jgi:hypothetical protein
LPPHAQLGIVDPSINAVGDQGWRSMRRWRTRSATLIKAIRAAARGVRTDLASGSKDNDARSLLAILLIETARRARPSRCWS